jgi:hypothetical protein
MPRNAAKVHCQIPGCKAWARRGATVCGPHLRARALRADSEQILPLLRAVRAAAQRRGPLDDLQVIDEELRGLFVARDLFMSWVDEVRCAGETKTLGPAQFLRAWNDSTARVVQLLRARRELTDNRDDEFSPLVQVVYNHVDDILDAE